MQVKSVSQQGVLKTHTATTEHMRLLLSLGLGAATMENTVFKFMDSLCQDYDGGQWEYCESTQTGAWYMRPTGYGNQMRIAVFGNFFDESVSTDAAGIIATLFALNTLCFKFENEPKVFKAFENLKDFAAQHQEGSAIYRAID